MRWTIRSFARRFAILALLLLGWCHALPALSEANESKEAKPHRRGWNVFAEPDSATIARRARIGNPFRAEPGSSRPWIVLESGFAHQPIRTRWYRQWNSPSGALRRRDDQAFAALVSLGAMRNVSSNIALGFGFDSTIDGQQDRIAAKPRVRYWVDHLTSLELAAGPMVWVRSGTGYPEPFWSSAFSINLADLLSFGFAVETPQFGGSGPAREILSVRLGSLPALGALCLAGVVLSTYEPPQHPKR